MKILQNLRKRFDKKGEEAEKGAPAGPVAGADTRSGILRTPKLFFHFSFGRHGGAENFELTQAAFTRHGPFHLYAPEAGDLMTKDYPDYVLDVNLELQSARFHGMRGAVLAKTYLMDRHNAQLGLESARFPDPLEQFLAQAKDMSYPQFARAQKEFIIDQTGLLLAPLDAYDWDVLAAMKEANAGKAKDPQTETGRVDHLFEIARRRERDLVENIGRYWGWVKPFARQFQPQILELDEVRVFVSLGAGHRTMMSRAWERYAQEPGIRIEYSIDMASGWTGY
jgi:hypothetical protein